MIQEAPTRAGGDMPFHGQPLTETETWILSQIVKGASAREIALRLFVYENTVKQQVRDIFRKIGVRTRAEAAAWLERTERASGQQQ